MVVQFTCPICFGLASHSEYLHEIFKDDPWAEYAACLVTHYRHQHVTYYDKSWRSWRYASKNPEYKNHNQFKIIVNNRAKRQLIRAARKTFSRVESDKLINGFAKLQYNDEATIKLIKESVMNPAAIVWADQVPEAPYFTKQIKEQEPEPVKAIITDRTLEDYGVQ